MLGWVKLQSYTRPQENILRYRHWQVGGRTVEVEEGRAHGPGFVAKLRGVEDRTQARELVGLDIAVDRSELPPPDEGELYWVDLIGSEVVSSSGAVLGVLTGVEDNGAQDVMVVVQGEVRRLIPYVVGPIVESASVQDRRIVVNWEPDY